MIGVLKMGMIIFAIGVAGTAALMHFGVL